MLQRYFFQTIILVLSIAVSAFAKGKITGKIFDKEAGISLPGANVILEGTIYGSVSDKEGGFFIRNIPTGNYTLSVSYLGYKTVSEEIEITSNSQIEKNINLQPEITELEEVLIVGQHQGQARALNIQKTAPNIKNIISADLIGRFPDPNVAEALQRTPALSIQRDQGEGRYINIRGTEARLNSVQINGVTIPSPEGDTRQVALDVIPADALSSIEVSKTLTSDMDADAIGGSVNLLTKNSNDFTDRIFKLNIGTGYNELAQNGIFQGAFTYGGKTSSNSKFGYLFSGSYYQTNRGSDNNEMEWSEEEIGSTGNESEVLGDLQLRDYTITRKRLSLSSTLNYKIDRESSMYLTGIYNYFSDQEYRRRLRARFDKGDYTSTNSVEEGVIERELKDRFEAQTITSFVLGGKQGFDNLSMDYKLSYSYAKEDEPDRRDIAFVIEDVNMNYDIVDPDFPKYSITNGIDQNDASLYQFDELVVEDNLTEDTDISGKLNFNLPFEFGQNNGVFKFGGKFKTKKKDRTNSVRVFDGYNGSLTYSDLLSDFDNDDFLDGEYSDSNLPLDTAVDPDKIEKLVDENITSSGTGDFEEDTEASAEDTFGANYKATENVYAGFLMANLNLGKKLNLIAGTRYEYTDIEYEGYELEFNEDGDLLVDQISKINEKNNYSNIFPSIQASYKLTPNTNFRVAGTYSLARPNHFQLVPFSINNREDQEITKGNPDLKPTKAMNFDFMIEQYFNPLGIVSGGFFYKDLEDYVYDFTFDEGENEVTQAQNGDNAKLWGLEFNLQQRLGFLPGALNGFGVYANYTFTDSEAEFPERDGKKATLPGQSKHVYNVALSYEKHRFNSRISMNYHGKYIDQVGKDETKDIYYDNHFQLDFSAGYKIRHNTLLYLEMINLTNEPLRYYQGSTNRPIVQEYYSWWSHIGVKIDF